MKLLYNLILFFSLFSLAQSSAHLKYVEGAPESAENGGYGVILPYLGPIEDRFAQKVTELEEGSTVMILGCGRGRMVSDLARKHPKINFIGSDISQKQIEIAEQLCPKNATFRVGDVTQGIDDLKDPVSLIGMFNVWHFLSGAKLQQTIGLLRAYLSPGGELHMCGMKQFEYPQEEFYKLAHYYSYLDLLSVELAKFIANDVVKDVFENAQTGELFRSLLDIISNDALFKGPENPSIEKVSESIAKNLISFFKPESLEVKASFMNSLYFFMKNIMEHGRRSLGSMEDASSKQCAVLMNARAEQLTSIQRHYVRNIKLLKFMYDNSLFIDARRKRKVKNPWGVTRSDLDFSYPNEADLKQILSQADFTVESIEAYYHSVESIPGKNAALSIFITGDPKLEQFLGVVAVAGKKTTQSAMADNSNVQPTKD
ncbi:MAG: class I SAM-dependent methyltransferase [Alphaproteobacteria bacterium]